MASAAFDVVRPPGRGLVVLAYHRVGRRSELSVDISAPLFAEQIAHLAGDCEALSLDEGVVALGDSAADGKGSAVAVTFDDGTADFVDEALPVLVAERIPVTLYVATDHIESSRPFPHGGTALSWSALSDAVSTGLVALGSHTHTHRLLDRVDGSTAATELDRSIQLIGDRLGVECRHFAYPKARPGSPEADREVRLRFRSAAVSGSRANPWVGTDRYRLARSPIQNEDGMKWFTRKVAGGMRLESDLRDVLDARRYRNASV